MEGDKGKVYSDEEFGMLLDIFSVFIYYIKKSVDQSKLIQKIQ